MLALLKSIFRALGVGDKKAANSSVKREDVRNPHPRKSGPGRKPFQGDGLRTSEQRGAGAFGRGMRNHFGRRQHEAQAKKRTSKSTATLAKRAANVARRQWPLPKHC